MSFAVTDVSDTEATMKVGGEARVTLKKDGTMVLPVSPTPEHDPKAAATMEALALYGGLPRFTPYLWGGRGDATPGGDTQSSGQPLLDLKYPTMRADVMASQFYCTEAEWQAEPMKRLTHWSLGDGVGWMRPPDKNCVQPGSVEGGFYGTGVGSASPLLGTAVLDTLQGHAHEVHAAMSVVSNTSSGQMPMNNGAPVKTNMVAKTIISDGVNGDPRVAAITKPRTWYGIWMIRMYGRVTNAGDLNAPALNARMDMIDAQLATLAGRQKALSDGQTLKNVTSQRALNTNYPNLTGRAIAIWVFGTTNAGVRLLMDGEEVSTTAYNSTSALSAFLIVPSGSVVRAEIAMTRWMEMS